jgi:hypothetical protein
MHWRTFNCICDAIQAQEVRMDETFVVRAARMLDRQDVP